MKNGMTSCVFVTVLASLILSGCGRGSKTGTSPTPAPTQSNEWTWVAGASVPNQQGTYGTLGTDAPANVPGARSNAVSWTDATGNLWLFGGLGLYTGTDIPLYNDLWRYSAGEWTWMSGSNLPNQQGKYGTLGTAGPSNVPGARFGAVWGTDAAGNLWLFGGNGYDSNGVPASLNDLWKYGGAQWTWVSGSNVAYQPGAYGTQGMAALTNVPGARAYAASWVDTTGSFWLFGGVGLDSTGSNSYLNDLWKYNAGEWTWMGGSNVGNQQGVYGTKGKTAAVNVPSGRAFPGSCVDPAGNFWLFGGEDFDGFHNDLWKYSAGQWAWMSGSTLANQKGTYGTQGTTAPNNAPGGRSDVVIWTDAAGNLWLFGGYGFDSVGAYGYLNDLWKFSAGEWTWIGGSKMANSQGTSGTQGKAGASNVPAARSAAVGWADPTGNLWLFGGAGPVPAGGGAAQSFNDLWKYKP